MSRAANRSKILAATLIALLSQSAEAKDWPQLTGDMNNDACKEAYLLATDFFYSRTMSPYAPIELPDNFRDKLSLHTTKTGISDGDALKNDPAVFERTEAENNRILYWQITPESGKRIAVLDDPGSYGDMYSVYVLDQTTTKEALLNDIASDSAKRVFTPVLEDEYQPATVLTDTAGRNWFIGRWARALPSWEIYADDGNGWNMKCTIAFMPEKRQPSNILPMPVQRLAAMLDDALGPDGPIANSTSEAIRWDVDLGWANAAMRPWAFNEVPYNTRDMVDAGLQQWADGSHKYAALYRSIQQQYPKAQRSLAHYYRTTFNLSPDEATKMAAYVTDTMFRMYFMFPGGQSNWEPNAQTQSTLTPWPRH